MEQQPARVRAWAFPARLADIWRPARAMPRRTRQIVLRPPNPGRAYRIGAVSGALAVLLAELVIWAAMPVFRAATPVLRAALTSPASAPAPPAVAPRPPKPPPPPPPPPMLLTGGSDAVPIVMYHDVLPRREVWFDLPTEAFARQMQSLADAGAHPVSLQDLYDHLLSGKPLPERAIVLTFDDGTLGHLTQVLPILKTHNFPAVFFVHTGVVGRATSKEHMTWEQLREAEATGLISVQSHTVTHPPGFTKLSDSALADELGRSRQELEARLGHPVRFLAYPSGECDGRVAKAALEAGYLAAVTMDRGWAASPAQRFFLPRLAEKRVPDILAGWDGTRPIAPPLPRLVKCPDTPLEQGECKHGKLKVLWAAGGDLGTWLVPKRCTVGAMAWDAKAQAALNGTFFADAWLYGTGCTMIGPVLCREGDLYRPGLEHHDDALTGRPMVLVGKQRCVVLPYAPHLGRDRLVLESLMPDVRDAFVAGAWIVRAGRALTWDEMKLWSTSDAQDPRHRAFVGIDGHSRFLLGAINQSKSTTALGKALEAMGVQDAWLMDSGFSTSLVWQNRVIASGHSRRDLPSRPVPHAMLLHGTVAPDAPPPPADAPQAGGPGAVTTAEAMRAPGA